jgi:hypothetical protein
MGDWTWQSKDRVKLDSPSLFRTFTEYVERPARANHVCFFWFLFLFVCLLFYVVCSCLCLFVYVCLHLCLCLEGEACLPDQCYFFLFFLLWVWEVESRPFWGGGVTQTAPPPPPAQYASEGDEGFARRVVTVISSSVSRVIQTTRNNSPAFAFLSTLSLSLSLSHTV